MSTIFKRALLQQMAALSASDGTRRLRMPGSQRGTPPDYHLLPRLPHVTVVRCAWPS
ncbi:MAG: hypothetical protein ABSC94_20675 [Polyangiaceae bacterium]